MHPLSPSLLLALSPPISLWPFVWTLLLTDEAMLFVDLSQVLLPWKEYAGGVSKLWALLPASAAKSLLSLALPLLQFTQPASSCCCCARFCFIFRKKFPWSLNSLMQRPSIAIDNAANFNSSLKPEKAFWVFVLFHTYIFCCCFLFFFFFLYTCFSVFLLCVKELIVIDRSVV